MVRFHLKFPRGNSNPMDEFFFHVGIFLFPCMSFLFTYGEKIPFVEVRFPMEISDGEALRCLFDPGIEVNLLHRTLFKLCCWHPTWISCPQTILIKCHKNLGKSQAG